MADPMMPPAMWANGVPAPDYAQQLLKFGQSGAGGGPLPYRPPQQGAQQGAQPNAQPRPPQPAQPQQPGIGANMNAMANTANGMPWATALMQMLRGGAPQQQPQALALAAPNAGAPGGVNPFPGRSPIY